MADHEASNYPAWVSLSAPSSQSPIPPAGKGSLIVGGKGADRDHFAVLGIMTWRDAHQLADSDDSRGVRYFSVNSSTLATTVLGIVRVLRPKIRLAGEFEGATLQTSLLLPPTVPWVSQDFNE